MHLRLQAHAGHTHGLLDPFLTINHKFLRQNMQDFLIRRDGDGLCRINNPVDIRLGYFPIADGHDAMGVEALDVTACNPRIY
jgi:hypothetical protein